MSDLSHRRDEIVALYTLSNMTLRKIADRFGASHEGVRLQLLAAGVALRDRSNRTVHREAHIRRAPSPARAAGPALRGWGGEDIAADHRRHLTAVISALGGRGFPFLVLPGRPA